MVVKKILQLLALITLIGCNVKIETIGKEELHKKLEESINNSAESWWYAGTKDEHYILVIKMPLSKDFYAVKKSEVGLTLEEFKFTKDDGSWVNIQSDNLHF